VSEIAIIGDSYVAWGNPNVEALVRALRSDLSVHGEVGWTVRRWLRAGNAASLVRGADAVLVHLGGNASTHRAEEVQRLDAQLRSAVRDVRWIPPPPYPAGSRAHGRDVSMMRAMREAGVRIVDIDWRLTRNDFAGDLIHLNRGGASRWAGQVARALLRPTTSGTASSFLPTMIGGALLGLMFVWLSSR
jgi:hypothetical protein